MKRMKNPPRARRWAQSRQNNTHGSDAYAVSGNNYIKIRVGLCIVGEVQGEEFVKRVRGSVHFLHTPPSIAFDISSLEQARKAGARIVRVIDDESGAVYRAPIITIFSKGFQFNLGHGEQIGLELQYWHSDDEPLAIQLELWG